MVNKTTHSEVFANSLKIRVQAATKAQFEQALCLGDIEYIYLPLKLVDEKLPDKSRIIIAPPVFTGGNEKDIYRRLVFLRESNFERIQVSSLAHIAMAREIGFTMHGSFRLNITNSKALAEYERLGLTDTVGSLELTLARVRKMVRKIPVGVLGYGRVALMTVRRCPVTGGALCLKGNCKNVLIDRKGNKFPLLCDTAVQVLNPDRIILSDRLDDFVAFDFLLMNFTDESDIGERIEEYREKSAPSGRFTRGLYYRGVK